MISSVAAISVCAVFLLAVGATILTIHISAVNQVTRDLTLLLTLHLSIMAQAYCLMEFEHISIEIHAYLVII